MFDVINQWCMFLFQILDANMICCFVPACKRKSKSVRLTKHKSHTTDSKAIYERNFFHPPSDPIVTENWRRAIPRSDRLLEVKDFVCDLHFAEHFIERDYEIKVGNDLVRIPGGKPKLCADAVPTLFPDLPHYLSKNVKPLRKLPTKRIGYTIDEPIRKRFKQIENIEPVQCFTSEVLAEFTFRNVVDEQKQICVESNGWISYNNDEFLSFAKCDFEDGRLILNASLSVSADMRLMRYYKALHHLSYHHHCCHYRRYSSSLLCIIVIIIIVVVIIFFIRYLHYHHRRYSTSLLLIIIVTQIMSQKHPTSLYPYCA